MPYWILFCRKDFLFAGNDEAGSSPANNQSLVSSCNLNGIDPEQYLTDGLIRIQPISRSGSTSCSHTGENHPADVGLNPVSTNTRCAH